MSLIGRSQAVRNGLASLLAVLSCAFLAAPAGAFVEETRIVSVDVGDGYSDSVRDLRSGGYELADGTPVSFSDWYTSDWRDLRALWMTEIRENFGLYWGFGTGERGPKYEIEPSLHLGFVAIEELSEQSRISISATTVLFGRLREKPCTADYGAIGGVQTVNCRLAASPMRPYETLDQLLDEPPANQIRVTIRYQFEF